MSRERRAHRRLKTTDVDELSPSTWTRCPTAVHRTDTETAPDRPPAVCERQTSGPKTERRSVGARKAPREQQRRRRRGRPRAGIRPAESRRASTPASPRPRRREEKCSQPKRDADPSERGSLATRCAQQRSARPRRSPHAGAAALKRRGQRRREPWPHRSGGRNQMQESPGDPPLACAGEPSAEEDTTTLPAERK